jgi:hypothetical protein
MIKMMRAAVKFGDTKYLLCALYFTEVCLPRYDGQIFALLLQLPNSASSVLPINTDTWSSDNESPDGIMIVDAVRCECF